MAILGDFIVVKSGMVHIGDPKNGIKEYWQGKFRTSKRRGDRTALIMYEHKGIKLSGAKLFINDHEVLTLEKSGSSFRVDTATFSESKLKSSGDNVIKIRAASTGSSGSDTNRWDDFYIKNIVVFFHQES